VVLRELLHASSARRRARPKTGDRREDGSRASAGSSREEFDPREYASRAAWQ
jgi:hypothetical protein